LNEGLQGDVFSGLYVLRTGLQ